MSQTETGSKIKLETIGKKRPAIEKSVWRSFKKSRLKMGIGVLPIKRGNGIYSSQGNSSIIHAAVEKKVSKKEIKDKKPA